MYPVQIHMPGTYRFDWRVGIAKGNVTSEHNDSWVKIEGDAFYATRIPDKSQVKPKPECQNDADFRWPKWEHG